jgi:hypothetical protein
MSSIKQVVIDFLVSKLSLIYHSLLLSYLALGKNIGKNSTTHDVVKATHEACPKSIQLYFFPEKPVTAGWQI